jgi:hypothetical protein
VAGEPKGRPRNSDDILVDKLIKQLPHADPSLRGEEEVEPPPRRPGPRPAAVRLPPPAPRRPSWRRSWGWLAGGLLLGAALSQWPYPRACGLPLGGYLGVVAVLLVAAGRAAVVSWMDRRAAAHVISWLVLIGGLAYSAEVVLPRVGYAQAGATWLCSSPTVVAPPAVLPAADTIRVETLVPDSLSQQDSSSEAIESLERSGAPQDTTSGGAS